MWEVFVNILWVIIYANILAMVASIAIKDILTRIPPLIAQIKALWQKPASSALFSVWQRNEGGYLICLKCGGACGDVATALTHTQAFHPNTENVQG
jgi:hypothetical protein